MSAAPVQSEKQFEAAVVEYARLNSWLVYHTRVSKGSAAGFPDLCMARRGSCERAGRLLFVELKSEKGRLSRAQLEWLDVLGLNGEVAVFRPSDWPKIEQVLR